MHNQGSPYCFLFGPILVGSDCIGSRRSQRLRRQAERQGGSIPDQLARTRGLAENEGREIANEFCDEGFSAYSGNRGPGLQRAKARAIELARSRGGCLLVALHSDRIARGAGDAPGAAEHLVEVVAILRRHGVKLRTVEDDLFADERIGFCRRNANPRHPAR